MTSSAVHLLDVGTGQYGDCVLCRFNQEWVLIDGGHKRDISGSSGHRSIPAQIRSIMGLAESEVISVSLLMVSHAHDDHVGCLPEMIASGDLKAEWALMIDPDLAWSPAEADASTPANQLFAILKEEIRLDICDRLAFADAMADAANLQARYRGMVDNLKRSGTKVVLHGKNRTRAMLERFKSIGMDLIGPSAGALRECGKYIDSMGRDFIDGADGMLADHTDPFDFYQQLTGLWMDSVQADGAFGPAINMQSSVIGFSDGRHRFLFSGDSQLEKPEVPGAAIAASVKTMRGKIKRLAPFDFVKVGHHGSYNALGKDMLSDLGAQTVNFGICTGSESRHHPSLEALGALKAHSEEMCIGRTDANGMVCFTFENGNVAVTHERGRLNDLSGPLGADKNTSPGAQVGVAGQPKPVPAAAVVPVPLSSSNAAIEVRIPFDPARGLNVSIQIKIDPVPSPGAGTFQLAAGRTLPKLLFVTNSARLATSIGQPAIDRILDEIRLKGHVVLDVPNQGDPTLSAVTTRLRPLLATHNDVAGVVIIGGYNIIPSEQADALDTSAAPSLRKKDRDGFFVWSDHTFGDVDNDGMPEIPVSRVPDGHSEKLLLAALSAPASAGQSRYGVRNFARPFADMVFNKVPGSGTILCSHPHSAASGTKVSGDHVYFMLHGASEDATRFWGETQQKSLLEAVHLNQLDVAAGSIVLTGCCWGALPVQEPAFLNSPCLTPRTAANSIALRCLEQGALAYVGCTGVHYSPHNPPYNDGGGPLHSLFWDRVQAGVPPAQALFEAKKTFVSTMGKRSADPWYLSVDRKLFEQFCLLGLGW